MTGCSHSYNIAALMPSQKPDHSQHINPWRMGVEQARLSGEFALSQLPRLQKAVLQQTVFDQADEASLAHGSKRVKRVKWRLGITLSESGLPVLQGSTETEVYLQCQRCLQPVLQPLTASFRLAALRHEQEQTGISADLEPLIVVDERIDLVSLIEDELLLALPIVPKHLGACNDQLSDPLSTAQDADHTISSNKPFADLAALLAKQKN